MHPFTMNIPTYSWLKNTRFKIYTVIRGDEAQSVTRFVREAKHNMAQVTWKHAEAVTWRPACSHCSSWNQICRLSLWGQNGEVRLCCSRSYQIVCSISQQASMKIWGPRSLTAKQIQNYSNPLTPPQSNIHDNEESFRGVATRKFQDYPRFWGDNI